MGTPQAEAFLVKAIARDIVYETFESAVPPVFTFDINAIGDLLCVPADPATVHRLVKLAADHDLDRALLDQHTTARKLGEEITNWSRGGAGAQATEKWISLRDWLSQNGHPFVPADVAA